MSHKTSIFVISGEASGDLHGAHLIESLSASSNLKFYAMGGKLLAKAGAEIIVDSTNLAIVGFIEVLSKIKLIRQAFKKIKQALLFHQPKLIILIDYPGFNLRLAKIIKNLGLQTKILYYISPQIWAWRKRRIHHIKKYVDFMAVIFPFEVPIYKRHNIPVQFVGNPLVGKVNASLPSKAIRLAMGFDQNAKVVGILPGSRSNELKYLLPTILNALRLLKEKFPDINFVLPLAPTLSENDLAPYFKNAALSVHLTNNTYNAISACDALIVASGTATLEVAMLEKPMVIVYKLSSLTYFLAKLFVKVPYFGLCNIMAEKKIVRELLQEEASPQNIAEEISLLLLDEIYSNQIRQELAEINQKLESQEVSITLPDIIQRFLKIESNSPVF